MTNKFIQYLLKNQVILVLFIIIFGWFILQIRGIVVSIFVSYIIMSSLLPFVTYLRKKKVPKLMAVLIVYSGLLILAILLIFPLVPFFVNQIQILIEGFPVYLNKTASFFGLSINISQLQDYINREFDSIGANAILVTQQAFSGLFTFLTIIIISFYLLLEHDTFRKYIARLFSLSEREKVSKILEKVDDKLGAWLRGQIFLCFTIGLMSWISLTIIQLPNALPLALLAGLLEAFPTIGPILSAVPAVIVALTISPTTAITVIIIYTVIQLLENNIIVPKVMEKAVGLNPIIVIIAVTTGAHLMGITGALLAIPFISFIVVLISSIREMYF